MLFLQVDPYNSYIWIFLPHPKLYVLVVWLIVCSYGCLLPIYQYLIRILIRDVFDALWKLAKVIHNKKRLSIASTRNGHGGELQNEKIKIYYDENDIQHNFSIPQTP